MINKRRLLRLTQKLIRINSENPPGDESHIGDFVKNYLSPLGIETKIIEFKKRRTNVLAYLKGGKSKESLLVTPHLDTVPAGGGWKNDPFRGEIKKNKIFGLGATDCKGNIACAMEAINSIVEDKKELNYDLIFAATADEENGSSLGLIPLLDKKILKPSAALVLDADDFCIIITQKGLIHLKVKIMGKRAHGAYPWRGVNAIDCAVDIIKELKDSKQDYPKNKYLRSPTVNTGTIRGGDKVNVVADWCEFELDFRFLPGMNPKGLLENLKKTITRYTRQYQIEIQSIQQPYFIKESHPLVMHLQDAMRKFKIRPQIGGSEGATVMTFFQHKKIPAVATGFGSSGCAHVRDEFVSCDNLYKGAEALEDFLINYRFN